MWTAIDYLGEAGLGRVSIEADDLKSFCGSYPWFLAIVGILIFVGKNVLNRIIEMLFGEIEKTLIL